MKTRTTRLLITKREEAVTVSSRRSRRDPEVVLVGAVDKNNEADPAVRLAVATR